MKTIKPELLQIAKEVNNLLTLYIDIHDSVFKFNLRHIIPLPFIFKAIDYPMLKKQTVAVLCQMRDSENKLRDLRLFANSTILPEQEVHFLHFIFEYVLALIETLLRFETMLEELCKKSEDSASYKYLEYRKHLSSYREAVSAYISMGDRLNALFYQLRN